MSPGGLTNSRSSWVLLELWLKSLVLGKCFRDEPMSFTAMVDSSVEPSVVSSVVEGYGYNGFYLQDDDDDDDDSFCDDMEFCEYV